MRSPDPIFTVRPQRGGMFQDATQLLQNSGDPAKDAGGARKETGKKAADTLKGLMQSLDKKQP